MLKFRLIAVQHHRLYIHTSPACLHCDFRVRNPSAGKLRHGAYSGSGHAGTMSDDGVQLWIRQLCSWTKFNSSRIGSLTTERITVPYVNIRITREGATDQQKAQLINGVTDLMVDVLGKNPATTFVIIDEVECENWGIGGVPVKDYRSTLEK